jgi:phosphoribosylformimino-5-aminoimidazole carboxamide ribotide isomerase
MYVIPALDLLGRDAVRLHQGSYDDVLFRLPLEKVLTALVAEKPALLHVVDLQGARDGAFRTDVLRWILERVESVPVQASGGLRSVADAQAVLAAGASRVIVGTAVWTSPDALAPFVKALGEQLVVALDIKDGYVAVRGWQGSSHLTLDEALGRCQAAGVARVHVTAVERDGTMAGPDLALYHQAVQAGLHVVAAGGVRNDADVVALGDIGCEAAVMGVGFLKRLGLLP